nr:PREDICTED: E3 ubiquitin-protein ligase TRIM39-like [Opisthocomus hoazin]
MREKDLQHISQSIQTLKNAVESVQTMQESTQRDLQKLAADLENQLGRTVEAKITRALESMQEKITRVLESMQEKNLQNISQPSQTLQNAVENVQTMQESTQRDLQKLTADLENRLGRTVEAKITRALESMREKDLQHISQPSQTLQNAVENVQTMQESTQRDLQKLTADLENQLGRTVEAKITRALESMREKDLQHISQSSQTLQNAVENVQTMQESTQRDLQKLTADLENQLGRTVEAKITRALESMREKDLQHISQPSQTLQNAVENVQTMQESTQRDLQKLTADLENQLGRTVEAKITRALESMREKDLQHISQPIQTLKNAFQTMQESTQRDLQKLTADLENRLGRTVEAKITRALESMREKDLQHISQSSQTLQNAVENVQIVPESTQRDLQKLTVDLENQLEFFKIQRYKVDVTLDADTAHPRLEISDDGKSVKDTGTIRYLPSNEKRFDSHIFVLAKEGFTSGKHYWEVDVSDRKSWALGIAQESVTRKGTLTLSPKNGFWGIVCSGKVQKLGIFLDISAKQLSFYNVRKKAALYTFTIADGSSQEGKVLPFFSAGSATAEPDTEPLKIVQVFDDDE